MIKKANWALAAKRVRWVCLLAVLCLLLSGCGTGQKAGEGVRVLLDGQPWNGEAVSPESEDDLRVFITCDGQPLIDVPFGEPRSVTLQLPEGGENTVALTRDSVYMAHADCENQDCVQMGAVTRDNLELRVMGGFIVCLPHRISVEVRER